ncbi:tRNA uridine-5-carboxymethylaminomethyl(34) synthesis GTPase MnmE [soil metagenome]
MRDPATGDLLDDALVLFFPAPHSFTGEDVVELHLHGSVAVCRAVLAALGGISGLRAAEPGEFTRRALEHGRLDLSQVEALADLIEAETEAQRRQALALLRGDLSGRVAAWRAGLVGAAALAEATIDFAEEDIPAGLAAEIAAALRPVCEDLAAELAGSRNGERIREGFEVALVGLPNVGKSTLLNAIAGRDIAMTSEVAGTTRDVLEVHLDLSGLPVTILDMAGLHDGAERLEAIGVERGRARALAADVRVFVVEDRSEAGAMGLTVGPNDLIVRAKSDLCQARGARLAVSGRTGAGIEELLRAITDKLLPLAGAASSVVRQRQRDAVEGAAREMKRAIDELACPAPQMEIVSEDLQRAVRALDFLVGKVDVEAVLDVIFSRFCIGK